MWFTTEISWNCTLNGAQKLSGIMTHRTSTIDNVQIAHALEQIADLLEFDGANQFRIRAYRNAAQTIMEYGEPVGAIVASTDRKLTDIRGIGADLADKISSLVNTGRIPMLDELLERIPASVLMLARIPGVGPKKAAALYRELGVATLDHLREACEAQRVRALKGFGTKTEQAILAGLALAGDTDRRIYWAEADIVVQAVREHLLQCPAVEKLEVAGSFRRGRETVADLDFLVVATTPADVMDQLAALPGVVSVVGRGDTKMSVRIGGGLQIDLRVVPADSFGAALQYFTGSKQHNVELRGLAKSRGLKINEYGVFRDEQRIAGRTEEEVYAALDLPCFPPELREARWEFEWAKQGPLPRLVELSDLQGDLHMHTTATDGKATLEEMCAAAVARGRKYIAITDHSKRVSMANGLDGTRLREQWHAIDALRPRFPELTILKGVEVDILEKGGLDLPDDVLAEADWVVASVHYGQNQPREQITDRVLGAIRNPYVSAIAHPTGRIINRRKSYEIDLEAVMQAARRHGKLMELNSNPARLDLDDVACAQARRLGIPIVISSDAHATGGMDVLRYGILQARRAGLTREDVANARPWEAMQQLIRRG
jgi:DNA polymerase (family 10)